MVHQKHGEFPCKEEQDHLHPLPVVLGKTALHHGVGSVRAAHTLAAHRLELY